MSSPAYQYFNPTEDYAYGQLPSQYKNAGYGDDYGNPNLVTDGSWSPNANNTGSNTPNFPNYPQFNSNPNAAGANDPISGLYQSMLGRAPDAAGLQYWQSQLASGKTLQDIQNAFMQTPEYQQRQQQQAVRPNPSTQANTNPYGITTSNPYASSTNPYIQAAQQTALGNLAGAQTATAANRVNQTTPYGSLQYTQTGTDAQGNPIWSANQTLSPALQALTDKSLAGLQQSLENPAYGINPGQTYSDAIMKRLQPQQAQAAERQAAALANKGIMPGSQAYNQAMQLFQQGQNDQLTSAVVGGMQTGLAANQAQNQTAAGIKSLATPGYVNPYTQAATSGPDYLGSFATGNAAQIAQQNYNNQLRIAEQNAANAKSGNLQSGLFNLLGTGIASGGASAAAGGLADLFKYFSGNNGLNNPFVSSEDFMKNIGATGSGFGTLFGSNSTPIDTGINDIIFGP